MAQQESEADSPYKLECKQSALEKLLAMRQLTDALNGEGGIKFSSLLPIANIINAIVKKDRPAYNDGLIELKSCIAKKNKEVKLQDLSAIAEINFLEGFDSFISYIYVGKPPQEGANTQSPDSSIEPTRSKSPKRRAPKRLQTQKEKEEPTRKSARPTRDESEEPEQEKEKETRPTRKSTRRMFEDKVKFDCAFSGCTLEFNSAKELISHADQCKYKKEQQLVFRCSNCKQSFSSDSDVKLHIYKSYNCASAAINIEAEKRVEKSKRSVSREKSVNDNDMDASSHEVDCPVKNCNYSSSNPDNLYSHVKHSHLEFNTTFKCRVCGETKSSGKAFKNHMNTCVGANFELKLSAKADDTEAKLHSAITDTPNDPTKEWDAVLRKCPIKMCGFSSTVARNLPLHFKRNHPESSVSFQCSKCTHHGDSIQEVMTHCTTCPGSRPEVLVNEQTINKRTPRSRSSLPPSTMVMRKRGRSSVVNTSSNKEGDKNTEAEEADMPVLEMIELDDDDDDMPIATTKRNEKEEDTIDVVSMDDDVKAEVMGADIEQKVDNALNPSDDESSVL